MEECRVCGEAHDESVHGEPETILQPSLHTMQEYAELVLDECKGLGVEVKDLAGELEKSVEWIGEIIDDAIERLRTAGYPVVEGEDTFLIYPKGE